MRIISDRDIDNLSAILDYCDWITSIKEGKCMSTYYAFYAAVKRDDKIEAIGPYVLV